MVDKVFLALLFLRMSMISNATEMPPEVKRGVTYVDSLTNKRYRIFGIAFCPDNPKKQLVIYEQLFASRLSDGTQLPYGSVLAGPKTMFAEIIYNPDGKKIKRFEPVEHPAVQYTNILRSKL